MLGVSSFAMYPGVFGPGRCFVCVCVGGVKLAKLACAQVKKAQTSRELLQSMINAVARLSE